MTDEKKQEIKDVANRNVKILIGNYAKLAKKGANYQACCPLHNEKSASFILFNNTSRFKCYGCGKSGDAIEFIKEAERLDYINALKFVANKFDINIDEDVSDEKIEKQKKKESILKALDYANTYFRSKYKSIGGVSGFNLETSEWFNIGFNDNSEEFVRDAVRSGYSINTLVDAGLVKRDANKDKNSLVYINCGITSPIFNPEYKIISFMIIEYLDKPNYNAVSFLANDVVIKELPSIVYGLNNAKNDALKRDKIYLYNSIQECIDNFQTKGDKNTIVLKYSKITDKSLRQIKRYTNNLTFVLNTKNEDKFVKALPLLTSASINTYALLEDGQELLFLDYLIDVHKVKNNVSQEDLCELLVQLIKSYDNPIAQFVFSQHVDQKLNLQEGFIFNEVRLSHAKKIEEIIF